MNLARASAVVWSIASFPLIMACGSASDNLFSASGGSSNTSRAGAAPGNETAGADKGGAGSAGRAAGSLGGANGESNGGLGTTAAGGASVGGAAGSVGVGGALAGASSVGGPSAGAGNAGGGHAGAGSTASAGASSGGTSGSNAGADGGGAAGASSCPLNVPSDNTQCLASTLDNCFYSGTACSCLPGNSGNPNSLRWSCFGTPNRCPEQKPEVGLSCNQNSDAACPYPGGDFCACPVRDNGQSTWACQPPQPTCSLAQPDEGAPCATVRFCSYGAVACFCNGSAWSCQGG